MTNETNEITPAPLEEEKTILLRKPVTIGEVTYDHLDLREPTAKELADAVRAGNEIEQAIALISRVTKTPKAAIEKLCQRDLTEASNIFDRFNSAPPPILETGSQS